ncbi:MAG: hypothetical protein K5739_03620 [Lachnospiraceae bacterium]|nr:hypothetical protein [Lachnospiraceae bacterium]
MGIGAISSYRPVIYNTNTLTADSLNPIAKIKDEDLTKKRIDQSELVRASAENANPLKAGETADFQAAVDRQMAMGMQKSMALFGEQSVFA